MPCDICSMYGKGCINEHIAERLVNVGYRKASNVALKVIGDIETLASNHIKAIGMLEPQNTFCAGGKQAFDIVLRFLDELKKKYTEVKE